MQMENKVSDRLLEALRCFPEGKKVTWETGISGEEWMELFQMAVQHQVLPMIYETVCKCQAFRSLPENEKEAVRQRVIWQVMLQEKKAAEFLNLYQKLLKENLTPVVVKGMICRELYENPNYRTSGDEDVLIPWEQFPACDRVFRENGMQYLNPELEVEKEGEVPYLKKGGALHIELHKELFSSQSEAYGDFNQFFEDVFRRKIQTEIQGVPIYTMGHTDHMLYLIFHAFKHFLHSGFGIRQVCDIVLYANTYGAEIDWEYLYRSCAQVHAENFAAALFDIGEKKLNFDRVQAHYPEVWQSEEADGDALLEDLLEGGVFGDSNMSRKHSSNITLQAVSEDKKGKKANTSLLHSVFPDRTYMERAYPYLKKYPFLLPKAWISRIGNYIKETRRTEGDDARESIVIGSKRVELLKKYKIIQ